MNVEILRPYKLGKRNCCFKCLQKGHMSKDCRCNRQCTHCVRMSHHRSLCPELFGNGDQSSTASSEGRVDPTETLTVSSVVDDKKTMLISSNQVLMQTATSIIQNTSGDKSLWVCMTLDSGSQRTYVIERLAKDLCLNLRLTYSGHLWYWESSTHAVQAQPLQMVLKNGMVMHIVVSVASRITGKINRGSLKAKHFQVFEEQVWPNYVSWFVTSAPWVIHNWHTYWKWLLLWSVRTTEVICRWWSVSLSFWEDKLTPERVPSHIF